MFNAPDNWVGWGFMILVAVICLMISAAVSGSEIAYFGLTPKDIEDLEESDNPKDKKAVDLLSHTEQLLATILIANNLVNVTIVVVLTFAISETVTFTNVYVNFLLQTVFLTFLLLLFGEIFPKLVAKGRPQKWVRASVGGMTLLYNALAPLARLMVKSTVVVNKMITKKQQNVTTDELEKALEISDVKEGDDKEMLEGILSFGEKDAREIMISRVDVTDIEYHDTWENVVKVIIESGYSRIPVYDTNQDSIRGVLYSKDLLPWIDSPNRPKWQTLIREAYFVPESRMIDDLLEDFRKRKVHMAIVIDEYGCTQGIVTLEDVIEEIVGEIDDEYDEQDKMVRKVDDDSYIFDAKIPLDDFCHILDIDSNLIESLGDAETLAGLMLEIKGDFPTMKETLKFENLELRVMKMERHRIMEVKVKGLPKAAEE